MALLATGCASAPAGEPEEPAAAAIAAGGEASAAATPVAVPLPPLPTDDPAAAPPPDPVPRSADDLATTAPRSSPPPSSRGSASPTAGVPVLIVVDEGTSEARPAPGELAQRNRRDAAEAPGAAPRITNDNLGDYARRGRVSMAGTPAAGESPQETAETEAATAEAGDQADTDAEPVRDEAWWRSRARGLREEWRATVDEIRELEEAAADLRWRFYAADDPWVRDGEVKPEWDRVLDRLSEARERLGGYPRRLDELAEEGRREGALPGWLREGVELEPRPEELPGPPADPAEPVEPRPTDEGRGDGR